MRMLLLMLFGFPFFSKAQINRSANELAREKVQEYIITKVFKDMPYKSLSYGALKPQTQPHTEIAWSINHRFEIVDCQSIANEKVAVTKPYNFSFYLDNKLKVIAAESFRSQ